MYYYRYVTILEAEDLCKDDIYVTTCSLPVTYMMQHVTGPCLYGGEPSRIGLHLVVDSRSFTCSFTTSTSSLNMAPQHLRMEGGGRRRIDSLWRSRTCLRTGPRVASLIKLLMMRVVLADTVKRKKNIALSRAPKDSYVWSKKKVDGKWRRILVNKSSLTHTSPGVDEDGGNQAGVREHDGYLDTQHGWDSSVADLLPWKWKMCQLTTCTRSNFSIHTGMISFMFGSPPAWRMGDQGYNLRPEGATRPHHFSDEALKLPQSIYKEVCNS